MGLVAFVAGGWYPYLRETVPMAWISAIATVALLLIGTKLFPDRAEEKPALDKFFAEIERKSID